MLCFSSGSHSDGEDWHPLPPSAGPSAQYASRAKAIEELKSSKRASGSLGALARGMSISRKPRDWPSAQKRRDKAGPQMSIGRPTNFVHQAHIGSAGLMVPSSSTVSSLSRSPLNSSRQSLSLQPSTAPTSPESSPQPSPDSLATPLTEFGLLPTRPRRCSAPAPTSPPRRGSLAHGIQPSPLGRVALAPIRTNSLGAVRESDQPNVLTKPRARPNSYVPPRSPVPTRRPQTAGVISASQSDVGLSPAIDTSLRNARRASVQAIKRKPPPQVSASVIKQAGMEAVVATGARGEVLPEEGDQKTGEIWTGAPPTQMGEGEVRQEVERVWRGESLVAVPGSGERERTCGLLGDDTFRQQLMAEYEVVPEGKDKLRTAEGV